MARPSGRPASTATRRRSSRSGSSSAIAAPAPARAAGEQEVGGEEAGGGERQGGEQREAAGERGGDGRAADEGDERPTALDRHDVGDAEVERAAGRLDAVGEARGRGGGADAGADALERLHRACGDALLGRLRAVRPRVRDRRGEVDDAARCRERGEEGEEDGWGQRATRASRWIAANATSWHSTAQPTSQAVRGARASEAM